jgi:hypothetical protein
MNYIDMDSEEVDIFLEEERKKCLKNIQNFYKKYGCEKIDILQKYLESLCETLTDKDEIDEIKKQIQLLQSYS